jgi:phage FluMu gp28-like protein
MAAEPSLAGLSPLINFLPYQRKWLADKSRFKIGMFSRQTGKTFTNCAELVDDCIDAEVTGRRTRWLILSRGERQAKEAMESAVKPFTRAFWELYRGVLKGKAPEIREDEFRVERQGQKDAAYRMFEVEFPGGSRITALPANPDTARGFSSNVLLDEFAFHADSKAIWGALFPVISKSGLVLRVVSTPNGKSNKFYDLMTQEPTVWSRHVVDIYDAVAQGLDRDIDMLRAGIGDADLWAQEYELKWLDEATAWLDYELIHACEQPVGYTARVNYTGTPQRPVRTVERENGRRSFATRDGKFYVGMDIARKKDLTCIWVAELVDGVLVVREIITMHRAAFWAQHAELDRIFAEYNPVRTCIDETGMGAPFVEAAQLRLGQLRVEGVVFTPANRLSMAGQLKERMEDRRFVLPAGDRDLRDDLHSITKAVSLTGAVRLVHDGESDGHGDRFWAAGLCCAAASEPIQPYAYHPVLAREHHDMSPLARRRQEIEHGSGMGGFRGRRSF